MANEELILELARGVARVDQSCVETCTNAIIDGSTAIALGASITRGAPEEGVSPVDILQDAIDSYNSDPTIHEGYLESLEAFKLAEIGAEMEYSLDVMESIEELSFEDFQRETNN